MARRKAVKAQTFMDGLRGQVRAKLAACQSCGTIKGSAIPVAAYDIGIAHSTLWRFLEREKGLSGASLDKLVAWLEEKA